MGLPSGLPLQIARKTILTPSRKQKALPLFPGLGPWILYQAQIPSLAFQPLKGVQVGAAVVAIPRLHTFFRDSWLLLLVQLLWNSLMRKQNATNIAASGPARLFSICLMVFLHI